MGSSAKVSSLTDSVLGRGWRSDKLSYQRGNQEVGARVEEIIEKEGGRCCLGDMGDT